MAFAQSQKNIVVDRINAAIIFGQCHIYGIVIFENKISLKKNQMIFSFKNFRLIIGTILILIIVLVLKYYFQFRIKFVNTDSSLNKHHNNDHQFNTAYHNGSNFLTRKPSNSFSSPLKSSSFPYMQLNNNEIFIENKIDDNIIEVIII
jgi:hypothetical protein